MFKLRVLGPLELEVGGRILDLPPSKKTRALLAYLAVTERAHTRDRLCSLLWDVPDDPRGALRWSLSKLRRLVDGSQQTRINASRDTVAFDTAGAWIDLLELKRAAQTSLRIVPTNRLLELIGHFRGEFLEGLNLSRNYDFHAWCIAEREEARSIEIRLRREVIRRTRNEAPERVLVHARALARLTPLEERAQIDLLHCLANAGHMAEAHQHLANCLTYFEKQRVTPSPALTGALDGYQGSAPAGESAPGALGSNDAYRLESAQESPASGFHEGMQLMNPYGEKPSILVLPLENLSSQRESDYFIDGMTDEIITALSHLTWLLVISRTTAFTYKNRQVDVRKLAGELGVQYVVEGAAIRSDDNIRINYRLIDARNATHIWAGRIDRPLQDIFAVQDEVAGHIAAMVEPRLKLAELSRSRRKLPAQLDAYDYYLRALPCIYGPEGINVEQAIQFLSKALELDPDYPPAAAFYAWIMTIRADLLSPEEVALAAKMARKAAHNSAGDSSILALAAPAIAYLDRDWNFALSLIDHALALNPNSVNAWIASGWIHMYYGNNETALEHFDRAETLSPRDPSHFLVNSGRASAYFQMGDYEKAADCAGLSKTENPTFRTNPRILAASLYYLGRMDEAKSALEKLRKISPNETLRFSRQLQPYRHRETADRQVAALEALGMPAGAAPIAAAE